MLRGIRYRSGRSFVVFVLAAMATTAAVLAPAYSRAAQQSVLFDALATASADATSLTVGAKGTGDGQPAAFTATDEIRLMMNQTLVRQPQIAARLDRPVGAVDTDVTFSNLTAKFAYRDHACDHLAITGTCPQDAGQILVSQRTAATHGVTAGGQLAVHLGPRTGGRDKSFKVTGVYTPKNPKDVYWGRTVYFAAGGTSQEGERGDAIFTMTEDDLRTDRSATLSTRLEYPLRADQIRLDDVPALRDGITVLNDRLRGNDLEVTTTLPAALDQIDADQRAIGRTAPVIAVPLVLLCWFVLFLLVASLTEERGPEIALAKLRGFPAGRAARFGLAEVLVLITAAVPVGLAAGLGIVQLAARLLLAGGTGVELRWPVLVAAGVALAAGLVATALAGRRTLARPVLALLRRVPERGGWRAGAAEGVVVALAGASLLAAASDRGSPLALLAAPMLAVVVGIAAARLLGLWSRARLHLAGRRGKIVSLLSAAQLARRPGGQRVVVVVTVAVALLTFAATAWDVAAQARRNVAEDRVGAQRVLTVAADHPTALAAAVTTADPGGHAMAVVRTSQRFGDGSVELVGVQADRLADAVDWRGHSRDEIGALAALLRPAAAAPLKLGSDVAVELSADAVPAKLSLRLSAIISTAGQPPRAVNLGVLAKGIHEYRAVLPSCAVGCRLVGLSVGRAAGGSEPFTVGVSVRAVRTDGADLHPSFETANRWRPRSGGQAQVALHPAVALGADISSGDPSDVVMDYVDTPDALPAVLAGNAPADDTHAATFTFPGFAEQPQPFAVAAHASLLPRAGPHGLLFDLEYAVRMAERTSSLADNATLRYEVWAGPGAPADLDKRLTDAGVQVLRSETIGGYLQQLGRRAPALGLWLYLLAGAAAILLAVGVVLLTAHVGVRGRLYELAALRVAGVRSGLLRRAILREYLALLGLPFVVGLVAGLVGALVMLPGIPLVTVGEPTGAFTYRPGLGALPVAVAVSLLGLLVAVLMVLRMLGRATPDRLREGGQP
jgi:putative ABC transport system permease protein